jgi:hypothetical protein
MFSDTFALPESKFVVVFSDPPPQIKTFLLTQKMTFGNNMYVYSDSLSYVRGIFSNPSTPALYSLWQNKISVVALGQEETLAKMSHFK